MSLARRIPKEPGSEGHTSSGGRRRVPQPAPGKMANPGLPDRGHGDREALALPSRRSVHHEASGFAAPGSQPGVPMVADHGRIPGHSTSMWTNAQISQSATSCLGRSLGVDTPRNPRALVRAGVASLCHAQALQVGQSESSRNLWVPTAPILRSVTLDVVSSELSDTDLDKGGFRHDLIGRWSGSAAERRHTAIYSQGLASGGHPGSIRQEEKR